MARALVDDQQVAVWEQVRATEMRPRIGDRRAHHGEDQVDIVNHQVENHRNIRATRVKLSQTMCFDKHRVVEIRNCRLKSRIETLHMSNLHLYTCFVRECFNRLCLFYCLRYWFLDKYMFAFS